MPDWLIDAAIVGAKEFPAQKIGKVSFCPATARKTFHVCHQFLRPAMNGLNKLIRVNDGAAWLGFASPFELRHLPFFAEIKSHIELQIEWSEKKSDSDYQSHNTVRWRARPHCKDHLKRDTGQRLVTLCNNYTCFCFITIKINYFARQYLFISRSCHYFPIKAFPTFVKS